MIVVIEKVRVQVKRVDQVELDDVDQVDSHQFPALDRDGAAHELVTDRVHRIHLVSAVEIGIEDIHHHHEFARRRTTRQWVNHECAVHAFVDVSLQRRSVAVIQVTAERVGIKFVGELLTRMMKAYIEYYNQYRPHQGLDQRIPVPVETIRPSTKPGTITAQPILGGLHHHYSRAA